MKKLDYNKFANFFYIHAVPILKKMETERHKMLNICGFFNFLALCSFIGIIIIAYTIRPEGGYSGRDISDIIQIAIYFPLLVLLPKTFIKKNFQKNLKTSLYDKVLKQFGLNYSNDTDKISKARDNIRYICQNTKIVNPFECINVDDIIHGEYQNLPFTMYDTDIFYYTGSGRHRRRVTAFQGIILATKSNKTFRGETIIKRDTGSKPKTMGERKNVRLEDVEFEKLFEVYSTDQIEARYLLTTSFMERLKDFTKRKKYPVEVLFSRRTYLDENLFFFFDTRIDHFEVDIEQNLLDKNNLFDVLVEINEMLEVVDDLKLDQNIGL